jgi:membrane protein implicated in regulation of membrane protease activity
MVMHGWQWLVLGLLLVVAEMTGSGGFYLMFFGAGALVVGILAALHLAGPVWSQILLFSVVSIVSLLLFRNRVLHWFQKEPPRPRVDPIIGELAMAVDEFPAGGVGRVELRGTSWSARNSTLQTLARGARCRVVRVEGLMLHIEPEGVH